jgi:hypothetical protein
LLNFAQEFGVNVVWLLEGGDNPKYYTEAFEPDDLKIRDKGLESYKHEDKMLAEVVNYLKTDRKLLETVWHLVKAKQGIRKINNGE